MSLSLGSSHLSQPDRRLVNQLQALLHSSKVSHLVARRQIVTICATEEGTGEDSCSI